MVKLLLDAEITDGFNAADLEVPVSEHTEEVAEPLAIMVTRVEDLETVLRTGLTFKPAFGQVSGHHHAVLRGFFSHRTSRSGSYLWREIGGLPGAQHVSHSGIPLRTLDFTEDVEVLVDELEQLDVLLVPLDLLQLANGPDEPVTDQAL